MRDFQGRNDETWKPNKCVIMCFAIVTILYSLACEYLLLKSIIRSKCSIYFASVKAL